jgi:transcriptional regulator with XRE-family HTH domain
MNVTGRQIAAARALLGMNQAELAAIARISVPTLKRMEAATGAAPGMANNVDAVIRSLEAAGIRFSRSEDTVGVNAFITQAELDLD